MKKLTLLLLCLFAFPLLGDNWVRFNETFTATGNGAVQHFPSHPLKSFSVQVVGTGGTPTLWTVVLEGSNDGVSFTPILTHLNGTVAINATLFTGASYFPCSYLRVRVAVLTLGPATNVVVHTLGVD